MDDSHSLYSLNTSCTVCTLFVHFLHTLSWLPFARMNTLCKNIRLWCNTGCLKPLAYYNTEVMISNNVLFLNDKPASWVRIAMSSEIVYYWKCNFPVRLSVSRLVGRSVGWSVVRSVCHSSLKGQEVTLPCSSRSTCLILLSNSKTFLFAKCRNVWRTFTIAHEMVLY